MDRNEICDLEDRVARWEWVVKYTEIRRTKLCKWVSNFHPGQLKCRTDGPDASFDKRGSYNIVCKVIFDKTGEVWAVRFPQLGKGLISDEKVMSEVAAIETVRKHTDIPMPEIIRWGLSADNDLGLGPFIISTWLDGISLGDVLALPDNDRMLRGDLSDATIEHIWRQIARFMFQLSCIDFDHIGSCSATPQRPLTIKSNHNWSQAAWASLVRLIAYTPDSISNAYIVLGPASTTFTSSIDYFRHIADHDLRQLHEQLNSVDDEEDARQKYINWTVIRQLIPRFVHLDNGPFKLVCDDFGPFNMMVDNAEDLNIVAVLDWEWSYAGPQELFWSPPLWLLGQPPASWEDGHDDSRLSRYNKYLDIWIRVVQEEEQKVLDISTGDDHDKELPSVLLRKQRRDGSMWFYHIMQEAFNGPNSVPFSRLREAVPDFEELAAAVSKEDTEAFVKMKMEHKDRYEKDLAEMKERYRGVPYMQGATD
ncbi:hypothetical protein D6D21_01689 [Aureobasidium pullulans]|uniref:Aminoglycoside phosphotransferase domain-containing protein n=1 Tax=Aureobasidium pullulans TaxID=5580 RepID=A0AB74J873_AURPU|nr:hypothetical protein D6D21_01689 [Aureobasidium pullulans]